ncbi:YhfH family protein [Halobacillus sp. BBL2006]|nr:YhfH family protein [Halobacillus sp. BBL2006]
MKEQKNRQSVVVTCPQCGSEVKGHPYTYMMECDRCLSKRDE